MGVPRICLECPEMARSGESRCDACSRRRDRMRNNEPKRRAYLNPEYRAQPRFGLCWICGKPGATTRDHVTPIAMQMDRWGEVLDHRARPAHRACNSARGARA